MLYCSAEHPGVAQSVTGVGVRREHAEHVAVHSADRDVPGRRAAQRRLQAAGALGARGLHGDGGGASEPPPQGEQPRPRH